MAYKSLADKQKYQREWVKRKYETNPEFRKRKRRKNHDETAQVRREVAEYKLKHGCSRCGYKRSARALKFHHSDDAEKEFNVGNFTSRKKVWLEIAKCIIVCGNCHDEIHDELDGVQGSNP